VTKYFGPTESERDPAVWLDHRVSISSLDLPFTLEHCNLAMLECGEVMAPGHIALCYSVPRCKLWKSSMARGGCFRSSNDKMSRARRPRIHGTAPEPLAWVTIQMTPAKVRAVSGICGGHCDGQV
jgi:hypothetical protein